MENFVEAGKEMARRDFWLEEEMNYEKAWIKYIKIYNIVDSKDKKAAFDSGYTQIILNSMVYENKELFALIYI